MVDQLAAFVVGTKYEDLSEAAIQQAKIRILDALACAIGALGGEPIKMIRAQIEEFGGDGLCILIGGGRTAPDRATLYNSALVRYLDFNDSYLAKGETCHPSDNLGAILAACEYAGRNGRDLLTSLAVAYQVQCRLSDVAPVRAKGFDHTTQGSYAVAAGVARALDLDQEKTANAIAISGTALNALRVTRTGALSNWKGLAYPNTAFGALHTTFLAMRGITGPGEVFEGNKGFMDTIAGPFELDWSKEDLDRIPETIVKKYNAEIHSQSTIEGVLELRQEYPFTGADIHRIDIDIFDVAYNIIGGGEEGEKVTIHSKEEADHSLPYLVAVAILDGQVMPEQYLPERIESQDVQTLLRKVLVRPLDEFSRRFPAEMPSRIRITLNDGQVLTKEKRDYEGFLTRPMGWNTVTKKFEQLAQAYISPQLQREIIEAVANLENIQASELTSLLGKLNDWQRSD
ncbi:MAG TPA: MmgE/PrpD family protein [Anaerolineales bacterium]|jgi:2-methylcitrate dehydratase|nr:MmgE/PrpD family protein [Anaerolineales bacterium]